MSSVGIDAAQGGRLEPSSVYPESDRGTRLVAIGITSSRMRVWRSREEAWCTALFAPPGRRRVAGSPVLRPSRRGAGHHHLQLGRGAEGGGSGGGGGGGRRERDARHARRAGGRRQYPARSPAPASGGGRLALPHR